MLSQEIIQAMDEETTKIFNVEEILNAAATVKLMIHARRASEKQTECSSNLNNGSGTSMTRDHGCTGK